MLVLLWTIVIVFNLVWIIRKKPYKRIKVIRLKKLKREVKIKQYD